MAFREILKRLLSPNEAPVRETTRKHRDQNKASSSDSGTYVGYDYGTHSVSSHSSDCGSSSDNGGSDGGGGGD